MPVRSRSTLSRLAIQSRAWREASMTPSSSAGIARRGSRPCSGAWRADRRRWPLRAAASCSAQGCKPPGRWLSGPSPGENSASDGRQAAQCTAHGHQVARQGMPGDDPVDQALQVGQRAQAGAQLGAQQAVLHQVTPPHPGAGRCAGRSSRGLLTHWRIRRLPIGGDGVIQHAEQAAFHLRIAHGLGQLQVAAGGGIQDHELAQAVGEDARRAA